MKEFRVAHIVPVTHLQDTANDQYHMCLAHLVADDRYREHFAKLSANGKFVLMDNGAAEGAQLPFGKLLEMYEQIQPTEIVLPDTLYEPGSTIQKTRNFLKMLDDRGLTGQYRVMAVPQGKTLSEWEACARIFVKDTRIHSIGVSKFLNIATNAKYIRVDACTVLNKLINEYHRTDLEVHLLGCDEGPQVVNMIHRIFPFVRGCDSAFAYLAAQANKHLTPEDDSRPEGTIDFLGGQYYAEINSAINTFNELAGVKNNGVSDSWCM